MTNFFVGIIIFICICIPIMHNGIQNSEKLDLINIIIAAISSFMLVYRKNETFSLFKMFIIFVVFFFCVAPTLQYKENCCFFDTVFLESDYILTSKYVLFILIMVSISYFIFRGKKLKENTLYKTIHSGKNELIGSDKEIILTSISALVCLYYLAINNFNIMSLMFRGGDFVDRITVDQTTDLILSKFCRPMPMIIFLCSCIVDVKHKFIRVVLFILMIISAPPTGMARFSAAAFYLPVLITLFPFFKKGNNFNLSIIIGLLVFFPFLDNFRNISSLDNIEFNVNFDQFLEIHFDSYSMFMRVLMDDVVTNGRQLLGTIFFFIPRSMWIDKPTGSGHYLMESLRMPFSNVSMPFFGEGYINFGWLGVVVFSLLFSYLISKIDSQYWSGYIKTNIEQIRYYILLALVIFILRGDLMSSFAYTCGFISSFYVVKFIIKYR